mgnify:CR=1 FL=1
MDELFLSIHAPARGATPFLYSLVGRRILSIHAPARGATPPNGSVSCWTSCFQSTHPRGVRRTLPSLSPNICASFQSTHPRGVRPEGQFNQTGRRRLSIHAPARGATWIRFAAISCSGLSIHAPARGATACDRIHRPGQRDFQSTHPRGVRHRQTGCTIFSMPTFNPRTRAGCDQQETRTFYVSDRLSIHAPARGATFQRHLQ